GCRSLAALGNSTTPAARAPTWPFYKRSRPWLRRNSISTTRAQAMSSTSKRSSPRGRRTRTSIAADPRPCSRRSRPRPPIGRAPIHVEYCPPEEEADKKGGFVVELARSGQEFVIPEGKSILQVLLDAGVDVDYSCELGICGACEQRVISGTPEHRDAILTEEE